jgi:succinate dehydrogenase/fumarate reductase cytochrome b subunit
MGRFDATSALALASRAFNLTEHTSRSSMPLRSLHRASALVVVAYAIFHIGNHLSALHSVTTHISIMSTLRVIYRQPVVEGLLLLCVLFQVASGLWMIVRGWAERVGRIAWLQALSGAYLALFLLVHVAAVLFGRTVLSLDTNFYFAAAGFHVSPYEWFFAPYYTLAVLALFAHVGCASYWQFRESAPRRAKVSLASALVVGSVASLAISLSLAGKLQPVSVPAEYTATYSSP